ncbi:hypothetical protein [uncultured Planktomarina sp.]
MITPLTANARLTSGARCVQAFVVLQIVSVEELVPTSGRRIDVMALRPK